MTLSLFGLPKTYKNLQRFQFIVNVLLKHGFGQLIAQLNLQNLVGFGRRFGIKRSRPETEPRSTAQRLRLVLEELGPCFVKFGQILSSRPDLMPPEFIHELKKLQEQVPPFPFSVVKKQLEKQFNAPLLTVFKEFKEQAQAAASIAQVHWATLNSGEEVVVKVQRPGITQIIETDINILYSFASLMERYIVESRNYDPSGIVEEFAGSINRELDFQLEANNIERFQHNFRNEPYLHVPKVYWDYTSKSVLTMERVHGIPIDDKAKLIELGIDPVEIAHRGGTLFLEMVLKHGFFHADPHPGNFFVLQDSTIALVDYGMVGRLEPEQVEAMADLMVALLGRDYDRMVEELINIGYGIREGELKPFRRDLRDLIEPYYGKSLKHLDLGDILQRIMEVTQKHHIRIPPDYLLLTRAILIIEGVGRMLDPDMDLVALGTPMAMTIIQERMNPRRLATQAYKTAREFNDFIKILPRQLKSLLLRINNNELRIEFLHAGLDKLITELDKASNRITFGLIITGLVIGSSLVMATEKGPFLLGYPALGVMGYGIAAMLGLWVLASILRSGRL